MSKIPFDIKYRPEIESGKYKVKVGEHDARIVCWDYSEDNVLIVLVRHNKTEKALLYDANGQHRALVLDKEADLELYTDEPELTQFERALGELLFHFCDFCPDNEFIKTRANELLELAQKELENSDWIKDIREWCYNKGHLEGYAKGQEDAEKRHKEATSFHYDLYPLVCPSCYGGGPCINPHRDCINCPHTGTSGIAKTDTNIK